MTLKITARMTEASRIPMSRVYDRMWLTISMIPMSPIGPSATKRSAIPPTKSPR
jgi:hypothetical protein